MSNHAMRIGDSVALVRWVLANDADMQTQYAGLNVATDRVGATRKQPWIEVVRAGGGLRDRVIDEPRIDLHCYGLDRDTTWDLASDALAALQGAPQGLKGFGCSLNRVEMELMLDLPDEATGDARTLMSLRVTVHSHPDFPDAPDES